MSLAPLQTINDKQVNTRSRAVNTPVKNALKPNTPIYSQHNNPDDKENNDPSPEINANNKHKRVMTEQPQPKKKKEKLSSLCKTPPSLIKTRGRDYRREHFLGEGGFARCFQIKDESGKIFAAKTVAKISIKSEKTKRKLLSEIQIHKSMKHSNIVQFIDCFEDDANVYILLEICPNGSLMDLLKKRKSLTEPEVRFFTTQICGAIKYLHSRRIIHRDLKLGNIFFDKDYNLKVGDFGLAAVLANDRERKYTVCGTPNYIAPEVLMGKHSGHSFEVDIWSIGVMIYALLVGKPPFQAKDVNVIYERIKLCKYGYPKDKYVSKEAEILIHDILSLNPLQRPTIIDIIDDVWFRGVFPARISPDVMDTVPNYEEELTLEESFINFKNCMANCGLIESGNKRRTSSSNKISSVTGNDDNGTNIEGTSNVSSSKTESNNGPSANATNTASSSNKPFDYRTILPHALSPGGTKNKYKEVIDLEAQRKLNNLAREARIRRAQQSNMKNSLQPMLSNVIKSEISLRILSSECLLAMNGILEAEAQKKMGGLPKLRLPKIKHPIVVTKWVDYSNKHGFSYQLSTEDIGVLFNNGTTVLRLADAEEFWYISYDDREGWVAGHYLLADRPRELSRHLEIVEFFAKYMSANLSRVSTFVREEYHKDDVFLRRYTRYKQFVMFELSDGTFQFNFKDHHKFAISEGGKLVTYISPDHASLTYPLVEVLKNGGIPNNPGCNFMEKLYLIKEGLKQKSSILTLGQT
ncbi:polo kinase CDC5 NDAI_0C02680 [Naumovozyma dairenensis CBS 421]|uniref:Serine/threonine-protein kinase n=1 Tax=Naumovozyma dairenensis (strain ATCC 10597 / BCRC 20456 / CBS 421 / NBRC 0211 / NRRL Y-12639) TaxID=1071378 RepID=G0W817_NAUDC|nr:hypothetical protein NDAI_0C02680 [Naumovozyma dairenensis CBS 421]CCD23928.1 hypothetical protein NDAI_0C02680 [Naumovozyma dairenensis CBS 421]